MNNRLAKNLVDDMAMDVGQSHIPTAKSKCLSSVVDP